ncbi:phage head closure protein [Wohlfahrtiimonas chitiniclastica]|uniref:phage head closure protein n=1 Tax=Wohlfahrtiimonas chitiniclastica TaxID=400946 RepID=UPI000B985D95|nr:phage head closure protein [Wohlfahrtiimonas chitiniclastica]MBS7827364.1 phage head closure protein [Wohlfahrtiimonas chitiniclastica]MBS7829201.1 phage head closure protein [Wohlfahrtiimonas chitiniclastica]MBS7835221.1 phage head closure protein [Wohlfahrtiimonas chitiniclastica]MBS7837181.1 phage head closure protein [Wohlfahrtiimonas chitiniclastica]OYQ76052.1 hypothetical protein B9T18_01475 [Wohlfahrtiimonas chitiniclastica]
MRAGQLRHRITLQNQTMSNNGFQEIVWQDYRKDVAAKVEPLSGNAVISANAEHSKVVARIQLRFDAKITAKMRVIFRDEHYKIAAVLPDNQSGLQWLTLLVEKGMTT